MKLVEASIEEIYIEEETFILRVSWDVIEIEFILFLSRYKNYMSKIVLRREKDINTLLKLSGILKKKVKVCGVLVPHKTS